MLHTLWSAARSVLAVLAGIIVMTTIAFAVELPVRALVLRLYSESFPDPAALDSHSLWMLSQFLYTVPALILGGYVTAWLAPHSPLGHAVAMAVLQEVLIVALIFNPPHPVPIWGWALTLSLTPIAIVFGGLLHSRRSKLPPSVA